MLGPGVPGLSVPAFTAARPCVAAAALPPSCPAIDSDDTETPRIRSTVEPVVVTFAATVAASPVRAAPAPLLLPPPPPPPLLPLAGATGDAPGVGGAAVVLARAGMNLAGTGCAWPLLVGTGEAASISVREEGG